MAPVMPGALPWLGKLPALARNPLAVFEQARAFGNVVRIPTPLHFPLFVLADPAHIRRVLQENAANYRRTPFHDRLKSVLGEGVLTSEGALWQRQRRLLQPTFRAERIRRFVRVMADAAAELADRWEGQVSRTIDVSQAMSDLTLDIAIGCLFGGQQRGGDARITAAVQEVQRWISVRFWSLAPAWTERLPTPANRRFRRALAVLDEAIGRIISARLASGELGDDLLGMLLAAQQDGGTGVDARQVRDEAMTMILAGHETSAAALSWAWHLLALCPDAEAAIRDEVARVLGPRMVPMPDDLGQLKFTEAALQEVMRLYPPAGWFPRLAVGPDRLGGHDIPAGAILALSPWLVQRDARFWPDPERFDPTRFAGGARPAPYTYFPFGGGPRTCLGTHFAMTEMLVALAVMVPRVSLRHASRAPVEPQLLITLRPAGGLPMQVERVSHC
ncbi:cytochrome P450 [Sabulicella rubraurantiaca]|uniref:cytochrome P450 n=1 Tax=Sabulicella rubraurantiaca TaxID=2811429 RepID=UPI001F2F076E|nr:cytochrome P450 [Sabulicella rubraurantiaca]